MSEESVVSLGVKRTSIQSKWCIETGRKPKSSGRNTDERVCGDIGDYKRFRSEKQIEELKQHTCLEEVV